MKFNGRKINGRKINGIRSLPFFRTRREAPFFDWRPKS